MHRGDRGQRSQPDKAGLDAAQRLLSQVEGLERDDLVVALSVAAARLLLPALAGSSTLEDEIAVKRGAACFGRADPVMNVIRKHASVGAGGRLAAGASARRFRY